MTDTIAVAAATALVQLVGLVVDRVWLTPRRMERIARAAADAAVQRHQAACPGHTLLQPVGADLGVGHS